MAVSTASIVGAAVIAALAFAGICLAQRVFDRTATHRPITLVYYFTNLANVLVALYFLCYVVHGLTGAGWLAWVLSPGVQFAIAPMITVVLLIFHFVLWGGKPANWGRTMERLHSHGAEAVIMHYAVPILTVAWWCAFANHGGVMWYHALTWMVIPAAYLAFLVPFAKIHGPIGRRKTAWPYLFMDMDHLGLATWLRNVILTAAALCALGFAYYGINLLFV